MKVKNKSDAIAGFAKVRLIATRQSRIVLTQTQSVTMPISKLFKPAGTLLITNYGFFPLLQSLISNQLLVVSIYARSNMNNLEVKAHINHALHIR